MTEHSEEEIGDDDFPIFTTNLNHLIDRGYPRGYADGLNAAWEGVAALDHAPRCELVWGCDCSEAHPLECTCNRDDALTAIDALKEKP